MTINECLNRFYVELDALASGVAPGFDPEDIFELFNKVQDDYIRQAVYSKSYASLEPLINEKKLKLINSPLPYANTYSCHIGANDFYYYLSSRVLINRTNPVVNNKWMECVPINIGNIHRFAKTPFNEPYYMNPVVFVVKEDSQYVPDGPVFTNYKINVMVDSYTTVNTNNLENFELTYVMKPKKIDSTTGFSLADNIHYALVMLAVNEAAKSIKIAKTITQQQQ